MALALVRAEQTWHDQRVVIDGKVGIVTKVDAVGAADTLVVQVRMAATGEEDWHVLGALYANGREQALISTPSWSKDRDRARALEGAWVGITDSAERGARTSGTAGARAGSSTTRACRELSLRRCARWRGRVM